MSVGWRRTRVRPRGDRGQPARRHVVQDVRVEAGVACSQSQLSTLSRDTVWANPSSPLTAHRSPALTTPMRVQAPPWPGSLVTRGPPLSPCTANTHVSHVPLCATCLSTHLTRVPAPVRVSCAELRVPQYRGEVAALEARKSEVDY